MGVSADKAHIQQKFIDKFGLTFPLVPDSEHVIIDAYDVRKVLGVTAQRTTFIVDPQGRIARVWPRVDVEGHADEVVSAIKELQQATSG